MRLWQVLAGAVALACAGVAMAGDPFNDARYAIGIKDNAKVIELLDSGEFDVNYQNSEGYTLLHFAADQNNLAIARELLRRGADPNIKTVSGSTVADMAYSGSMLLGEVLKAGGVYARNAPAKVSKPVAGSGLKTTGGKGSAKPAPKSKHAKVCEARHYSSSALCSDSTCRMREYRKWQTCLKTGSYY